ncbi:T7SS effector LXG polymorphic toxin [Limosilactobacillus equigenerosi]|nr:T7SS effector LXG polymorphic toxin [Limosilactobacillus equigenerosi]
MKVNYSSLLSYSHAVEHGLASRNSNLSAGKSAVNRFVGSGSLQGAAGEASKAYLNEVQAGIANHIATIVENLQQKQSLYVGNYPEVDRGGSGFFLDTVDYEALASNINKKSQQLQEVADDVSRITSSVSDICASGGTATVTGAIERAITNLYQMNQTINNQSTAWNSYESSHSNDFADILAAISGLKSVVASYAQGAYPSMANYYAGGFGAAIGVELGNLLGKLGNENLANANLARAAQKKIDAKYSQLPVAKNEKKKRQEKHSKDGKAVTASLLGLGLELIKESTKESFSDFSDEVAKTVLKEGKNIGRHLGTKLMPRDSFGRFMKVTNPYRKAAIKTLYGISDNSSKVIGKVAKGVATTLTGIDFINEAVGFAKEHKKANVGRCVTYAGAVTGTTFVAGIAIGAAVSGTFAPVVLAAGAGMAISAGAKQAYKHNFLGFRDGVNKVGDAVTDSVLVANRFNRPIGMPIGMVR